MHEPEPDPSIALVGWSVGGPAHQSTRAISVLERSSEALVSGVASGAPIGSSARPDHGDARAVATDLAEAAAAGRRAVWLCDGDPLGGERGRAIGSWLTALGVAWEYVPPPAIDSGRAAAIAHLACAAVTSTVEGWHEWRSRYPLLGLVVAVTRAEAQAASLVEALSALGADALSSPTIAIAEPEDMRPLDDAIARCGAYAWAVFTSANGVDRFFDRMRALDVDVRALSGVRLAAIGPATAAALGARGLRVDLVPEAYVAESLVESFRAVAGLDRARVLLARAAVARDVLPDALRAAGATVDVVEAYRTIRPPDSGDLLRALLDGGRLDLATFTSSSTVTNFVDLVGEERARGVRAACIGPVTAATARDAGLELAVVADDYTVGGLVDTIVRRVATSI